MRARSKQKYCCDIFIMLKTVSPINDIQERDNFALIFSDLISYQYESEVEEEESEEAEAQEEEDEGKVKVI